jgi:hemerythrin superfamily protein
VHVQQNVADLIRQDHREMERLFEELREPAKRVLVAPTILALLAAHSRAEESEVYPAVRQDTDAQDKVAHSQEEHAEADQLVARLVETDADSPEFDQTLKELVAAVQHHIQEEEESVLTALDELPSERQRELAAAFAEHRSEQLTAGVADLTRRELEQQARNEGIGSAAGMSKEELKERVSSS